MAKRRRIQNKAVRPRRPPGSKPKQPRKQQKQQQQRQQQLQQQRVVIPFEPADRILLIGEGDLSFAASLVKHHGCVNVTATVLEKDHASLVEKYPHVDANIAVFLGTAPERDGEERDSDPTVAAINAEPRQAQDSEADSDASSDSDSDSDSDSTPGSHPANGDDGAAPPRSNKLIYHVDATKLPASLTRAPPHQHILFNFPHVGGKSTDVNRQVRHNQSLLVAFFASALPALAPRGSIVVTLFDGEPYTLWNVRDLARHAGLAVDHSFVFRPDAYPGYRHARTCGVVKSRSGVPAAAWKGEDRPARSYVFRRKGEVEAQPVARKKRLRGGDDDSSDDDDDD